MTIEERNKLVLENDGLVHTVAHNFLSRCKGTSIQYDDLYQAGQIGLIRAADKYDPSLGYQFSTYAIPWIEREVRYAVGDELPYYIQGETGKIRARIGELEAKGEEVTLEAIAEATNVPVKRLEDALPRIRGNVSMDATVEDDGDSFGTLFAQSESDTYESVQESMTREEICKAIKRLPMRTPRKGKEGSTTLSSRVAEAYENLPKPNTPGYEEALLEYAKLYNEWLEGEEVDEVGAEILFAYYFEDKNLDAIRIERNISRQRVHQKKDKALLKLKMDPIMLFYAAEV